MWKSFFPQCAKRRFGQKLFHIAHAILDVVGRRNLVHLQLRFRTLQFCQQRFQQRIAVRGCASCSQRFRCVSVIYMLRRRALRSTCNECRRRYNPTNQSVKFHGFTSDFELSAFIVLSSNPGGGNSGGRSCSCARFCTSISLNNIAGAAAETGTLPLSAPHTPLNTCC